MASRTLEAEKTTTGTLDRGSLLAFPSVIMLSRIILIWSRLSIGLHSLTSNRPPECCFF